MDYTEIIKNLCNSIYENVLHMSEKFKFDRTFDAVVVGLKSANKCYVEYQGRKYTCSYSSIVRVGDRVKICAPQNDWNMLYVVKNKTISTPQTKSSVGGFYYDEKAKKCFLTWIAEKGEKLQLEVSESGISLNRIKNGIATNIWSK